MKGRVAEVLRNWPARDVRFLCVSTGGRILGLGDIGANGMGIPIGKLQLYTACAAVPPDVLLPVLLDIGTTNAALRADPLYLGLRHAPPPQEELDAFVDEFVSAVQEVFPGCCIHFEDWKGTDAHPVPGAVPAPRPLLQRRHPGHGERRAGGADHRARDQGRAGSAISASSSSARARPRIGIAGMLVSAMQGQGLSKDGGPGAHLHVRRARAARALARRTSRPRRRSTHTRASPPTDLAETIEALKPTILIGVSTKGGAFDQRVVEAMSRLNERPIIFALSNPTDRAECTAEQAYALVEGQGALRGGRAVPGRDGGRQDVPPRPGQQLPHLPGDRARGVRDAPARASPTRCSSPPPRPPPIRCARTSVIAECSSPRRRTSWRPR